VSLLVDRALRRQQISPHNRMLDTNVIVVVASTFLLAGMAKGVIGLGLPAVSLGLLTVAFDLPTAMSLLLVPSFVTNIWQASVGGNDKAILLRLWPFLVMATVTVWVGAQALTRVDVSLLSALLGVLLVTYSMVTLRGIQLTIPACHETSVGTLVGAANGVLTGMTGSSVVPGVMFLQAIGLSRDMLITGNGNIVYDVDSGACARIAKRRHSNYRARHSFVRCRASRNTRDDPGATCSKCPVRATVSKGFLCLASSSRRLHYCQRTGIVYLECVTQ